MTSSTTVKMTTYVHVSSDFNLSQLHYNTMFSYLQPYLLNIT